MRAAILDIASGCKLEVKPVNLHKSPPLLPRAAWAPWDRELRRDIKRPSAYPYFLDRPLVATIRAVSAGAQFMLQLVASFAF